MAAITKAILGEDISGELRDECSAHLDTLFSLGTAKSEYYAEKINTSLLGAGQGTDKTFPISTIQSFIYDTRAYTSDNAENISSVVNGAIDGFVAGDNAKATETIVTGLVNMLFGSSGGSESEKLSYFAILEGVSMIRIDFAGWSKEVTSTAMKSKCDKVSAFVLYRSIVDMKKVSLNDFISVYQDTVKVENPELEIEGILKKCQDLYGAFNPTESAVLESTALLKKSGSFYPTKGHTTHDVFREKRITL
jgi:hypothetical protein